MTFCVYWIREASHVDVLTQGYVGISGNVDKRFASHKGMWSGTNTYLKNAIKKYGWEQLVKSVLVISDKDYCLALEKKLRPENKIGWNLTIGGGFPPNNKGPQPNRKGKVAWNKGKTGIYSAEALENMRQRRIGVAPANKGVTLTVEQVEVLRKRAIGNTYRRGKKMPAEAKEKISKANKGRVQSVQEKMARSNALKGRKKTVPMQDAHKQKLATAAKGKRWYNNGSDVVFCLENYQPEGYVLGRKPSIKQEKNLVTS